MSLKHLCDLCVYLIGDFIRAEASGEEQGGCADESGPAQLCAGFHMRDAVSEKGWLFRCRGWGVLRALRGVAEALLYIAGLAAHVKRLDSIKYKLFPKLLGSSGLSVRGGDQMRCRLVLAGVSPNSLIFSMFSRLVRLSVEWGESASLKTSECLFVWQAIDSNGYE